MGENKLTIVCWYWQGWRPVYSVDNVYRMKDMVSEHLKMPHRFVLVTDQPDKFSGIETVKLWKTQFQDRKGIPNCYARLFLFSDKAKEIFGEKVASIDLDGMILNEITTTFTDDPFKILKGSCNPYNGSLWQVEPGRFPHVWDDLTLESARRAGKKKMPNGKRVHGSDQVFMAYKLPNAPVWTREDGIYQFSGLNEIPENAKIVFFAGLTKPWDSKFKDLYWGRHASAKR